jgi:DNA-binding MarR family transcriptional regulator
MTGPASDRLDILDDALLRMRRLWSPSRQRLVDEGGVVVEMSSLLVVEACARGSAAGLEVSVADVALLADVAPSTASRLVDRAAGADLVNRETSRVDPRRTALSLTERGATLQARACTARTTWLAGQFHDWAPRDVNDLARLLARFADTLEPDGDTVRSGPRPVERRHTPATHLAISDRRRTTNSP